jgi:hypothetical protein
VLDTDDYIIQSDEVVHRPKNFRFWPATVMVGASRSGSAVWGTPDAAAFYYRSPGGYPRSGAAPRAADDQPLSAIHHGGGLVSYGPDTKDIFERSAVYLDRILKGANPSDLLVQAPTKFELAVNLKPRRRWG